MNINIYNSEALHRKLQGLPIEKIGKILISIWLGQYALIFLCHLALGGIIATQVFSNTNPFLLLFTVILATLTTTFLLVYKPIHDFLFVIGINFFGKDPEHEMYIDINRFKKRLKGQSNLRLVLLKLYLEHREIEEGLSLVKTEINKRDMNINISDLIEFKTNINKRKDLQGDSFENLNKYIDKEIIKIKTLSF
jgi:hypothetical protein